jgi:hypothetical protein
MRIDYRCLRCGMNMQCEEGETQACIICEEKAIFVVVTEENRESLPFPTHPYGKEDPAKVCQCATGRCPCGKYVAHAVNEPCIAPHYIDEASE